MRQDDVLNLLRERGPMTARQVGDTLAPYLFSADSRRITAGKALRRLYAHGYVQREYIESLRGYLWRVKE